MQITSTNTNANTHFKGLTFSNTKMLKTLNSKITKISETDMFQRIKTRADKNDIVDVELFFTKENALGAFIWQRNPKKHGWTPNFFVDHSLSTQKNPLNFIEKMVIEAEILTQQIKKGDI